MWQVWEQMRGAYRVLVENPRKRDDLEDLSAPMGG